MSPARGRLYQERADIHEVERLRDLWIADVAHAIHQPITVSIQGLNRLEAAHEGEMSDEEKSEFRRIQATLEGLARLLRDVEQFSRIDARHLELQYREIDLKSLFREVVSRLSPIAEGRSIPVVFRGPPSTVWIDPSQISHVLTNLVSNAIEYGNPGTPIEIEGLFNGGEVRISVTNLGRGIPPERLPHLFERSFSRSLKHRDIGVPGLGLGLFVVRGLVEAHGGRIWAESKLGKKTVFTFTLPLGKPRRLRS